MAITTQERQVLWSTSTSVSVSAAGSQTSDVITSSSNVVARSITLKADNAGTPASGDKIKFYLLGSCGDPDGASTAEYSSAGHGNLLATLDTNVDDPAIKTILIDHLPVNIKILAVSSASSNSITVSACIEEQNSA